MGTVGPSISAMFPFATWNEALGAVNHDPATPELEVVEGRSAWWVMTGDQLLFSSPNVEECGSFVLGVIVGGAMFADPPLYPKGNRE